MPQTFFANSLTVLELGERKAVGAAGSLLAQLGCRVIQIEPCGDAGAEQRAPRADLKWSTRAQFACSKWSVALDPASPPDLALAQRLADAAHIVLTSADVDRIAVEVDAESKVHCQVTAFGADGPLQGKPHTDTQVQALSGILDTTGMPDCEPIPVGGHAVEFATGIYAAAACVAAARVQRRDGLGQNIDMALFDCAYSCVATFLPRYLVDASVQVHRVGNRHPMTGPWNVYAASDGWALICSANDAQWQRLCAIMERPDLAANAAYSTSGQRMEVMPEIDREIAAWAAERTVSECVAAFEGSNVASGPIAPMDHYPREANLDYRGMICSLKDPHDGARLYVPGSPIKATRASGLDPTSVPAPDAGREAALAWLDTVERRKGGDNSRPATSNSTRAALPLAGIRVLEIGHYTTAPLSARHLSSLGAEVIKIEPRGGEGMRAWPPSQAGQGVFFTFTNTNKRSMALDLGSEVGAAVFKQLIETADVLIENLKPGALERRGLGPSALSALNSRLIYCAISGFGEDSIYAGRAAFDTVIQAMCGMMAINLSGGVPVKAGISTADLMGAELCVLNVLAALEARERTGHGEYFDLAMQDVAAWATQTTWNVDAKQSSADAPRMLACNDGFVVVEGAQEVVDSATALSLSRQACAARIEASGGVAAPVLSVPEATEHPQNKARGLVFRTTDASGIEWPMLASPLRLELTPPLVTEPMGVLGRDTDAILKELGLNPDDPKLRAATASV